MLSIGPSSNQSFILPRSIKWVPGTLTDLVVKSTLSRSISARLRHLNPMHKKGQKVFLFFLFCCCCCFLFLLLFCFVFVFFYARKNSFLVRFSKSVSIVFFSPISVLVEVCSTNLVDIRSSRFLLAKRWFSSDWKRSLIAFL